jgi:hypothetical protein
LVAALAGVEEVAKTLVSVLSTVTTRPISNRRDNRVLRDGPDARPSADVIAAVRDRCGLPFMFSPS